jgi:hypothetical protein
MRLPMSREHLANISLGRKCQPGTNTLAYFLFSLTVTNKSFQFLSPARFHSAKREGSICSLKIFPPSVFSGHSPSVSGPTLLISSCLCSRPDKFPEIRMKSWSRQSKFRRPARNIFSAGTRSASGFPGPTLPSWSRRSATAPKAWRRPLQNRPVLSRNRFVLASGSTVVSGLERPSRRLCWFWSQNWQA